MHVIADEANFTLIGSNARHGKLTLFDADGPREHGPLKHVGLRVSDLAAARAELPAGLGDVFEIGEGIFVTLVEAETDVEYDLDHVALWSADPEATATQYLRYGFEPAGPARVEVGGAYVDLHEGDPSQGGPAAPQPSRRARRVGGRDRRRRARARDRGRVRGRRREHLRGVPLGPGSRADRVRRAQAHVLLDVTEISVAGAGMAGLVAAARLRELGRTVVVREKGTRAGGSMLLSSCVVWRHRDRDAFRERVPAG